MLTAIHTTYPRFKLRREQLPPERIHCRWFWHTALLAAWRYGLKLGSIEAWWLRHTDADFGRWLARNLPPCDALVALSGSGLRAGRVMHRRGGAYICDRASTHIRWAEKTLHEEFRRWGDTFPGTALSFMAKEEEEYAEADLVTVPSTFAARSFVESGVAADKVRVVPFGVELARFSPTGRPVADEFRVIFVGQVSFRKGVPYLLEAFRRLRHPRKKLTIIGAMQPEMKRWLGGRSFTDVEFLGVRPQPDLPAYMSTSHVHVLASIEEGLAYVQAQAMACGCPLISTTNTGVTDLITDGIEGFIVPVRDVAAIAVRLQQLADDCVQQKRMAAAALNRVKSIGGWDAYGEMMVRVISEAVGLARRRKEQ